MRTSVDPRSESFRANRDAMTAALAEIEALNTTVVAGGGSSNPEKAAKAVDRHHDRGKLPPRERIEPARPRLPVPGAVPAGRLRHRFRGRRQHRDRHRRGRGRRVHAGRQRPDGQGRHQNPWTLKKMLRANQIAENRLPVISLVESGGADLPTQKEIFIPGGQMFRDLTRLSAAGIPTDRAGVRQLHRRRRLHPRHVRPRRDDQERSQGVPGRAAAGEDGHRRGVRRRVARRRRDARPHLGSGRLLRRRRARRHPDRPPHRRAA